MQPAYQFAIAGNVIDFAGRVISINLTTETPDRYIEEVSDTLEIVLDNMAATPLALPPRGRVITASLGWQGQPLVSCGTFVVDETEVSGPPDILTIRAQSNPKNPGFSPYASIQTRKDAFYPAPLTVGDLVGKIAAFYNLTPAVDQALASVPLTQVNQVAESDFDVLGRVGRVVGGIPKILDGKLIFARIGTGQSVSGAAMPGITVTKAAAGTVIDPSANYANRYSVKFTDWIRYQTVTARYHDFGTAKDVEVSAGSGAEPILVLSNPFDNADQALKAAKAALQACDRRAAEVSVTIPGAPTAKAEGLLTLQGFGAPMDDDWSIRRVAHRIDKETGWTTEIEANRLSSDSIELANSATD